MMIQDLHSHTKYSFCSPNPTEEDGVLAAVQGGTELFGICDHNYGIAYERCEEFVKGERIPSALYEARLRAYHGTMSALKLKYADKIRLLVGVELATAFPDKNYPLPEGVDISFFDYCLIEHLDFQASVTGGDLFAYAKRCGCPVGVAHTDLFGFIEKIGADPLEYFTRMAQEGIFWEMNVSFDSIHQYREHAYVKEFFANKEQQEIVKRSGVSLSVGFDGHLASEYAPQRVREANIFLQSLKIPLAFEDIR